MNVPHRIVKRLVSHTLLIIASVACASAMALAVTPTPEYPVVSTIAGSGEAAVSDGTNRRAAFLMPFGIADGPNGVVYITDAAANRLVKLSPGKGVQTIIGPRSSANALELQGGFSNGAASTARLNYPTGLAVLPNGDVLIADLLNHCVRKLSGEQVSTAVGKCGVSGDTVGAADVALLSRPIGLAVDSRKDVLIADLDNGIEVLDSHGVLSHAAIKTQRPTSISVFHTDEGDYWAIADRLGLAIRKPSGIVGRFFVPGPSTEASTNVQGNAPLGFPFGVVMLGPKTVVYTDERTHSIHVLNQDSTQLVAGASTFDPDNNGGGYADAVGAKARFFAPLGIAAGPGATFLVADAGNRRIRSLSAFDLRSYVSPIGSTLPDFQGLSCSVAIIGNSFVWDNTDWHSSVAGRLSDLLHDEMPSDRCRVEPVPFPDAELGSIQSYVSSALLPTKPRVVVLLLNSANLFTTYGRRHIYDPHIWEPDLAKRLKSINEQVTAAGGHLLVVTEPYGWEYSPTENLYAVIYTKSDGIPLEQIGVALNAAVDLSGVPSVDLWPAFAKEERSAGRAVLYGTFDPHWTRAGRDFFAEQLFAALKREGYVKFLK